MFINVKVTGGLNELNVLTGSRTMSPLIRGMSVYFHVSFTIQ